MSAVNRTNVFVVLESEHHVLIVLQKLTNLPLILHIPKQELNTLYKAYVVMW